MVKQFWKFGSDEIEKKSFHSAKDPIAIGDVNINKLIILDASPYGKNKKS